jgi:hypothetical protein
VSIPGRDLAAAAAAPHETPAGSSAMSSAALFSVARRTLATRSECYSGVFLGKSSAR